MSMHFKKVVSYDNRDITVPMNFRKLFLELSLSFLISYLIYSLVDFELYSISGWDQDRVVNLLHTWVSVLTSYYLYNACLRFSFQQWENITMRGLITVLFGASLAVVVWFVITDLLFYKLYYNISSSFHEQTTLFEFDLPITFAVVMIGSTFYYQKNYIQPISEEKNESSSSLEKLTATKGNKQVFIDYKDIALIYIENQLVIIHTLKGEKHYTQESLTSIIDRLDGRDFFRLNRQVIISKAVVKAFEKLDFQKLAVLLIDSIDYEAPLIVSKYNAPSFKKWLTNSH